MSHSASSAKEKFSLLQLLVVIALEMKIPTHDVCGALRRRAIHDIRRVFTGIARERGYTYVQIALYLRRHVTTVYYLQRSYEQLVTTDLDFIRLDERLRAVVADRLS